MNSKPERKLIRHLFSKKCEQNHAALACPHRNRPPSPGCRAKALKYAELYTTLQGLSLTLFEKTTLDQLLANAQGIGDRVTGSGSGLYCIHPKQILQRLIQFTPFDRRLNLRHAWQ